MSGPQLPISAPSDDDALEVNSIPLRRNPPSPINAIASFIDGSSTCGSGDERAAALRLGKNGRPRAGPGNLLPSSDDGACSRLTGGH